MKKIFNAIRQWRLRRRERKLLRDALNVMTADQLRYFVRSEYPELGDVMDTSFLSRREEP